MNRLLIYPYWNVNEERKKIKAEIAVLLIYPYWNVNEKAQYNTGDIRCF